MSKEEIAPGTPPNVIRTRILQLDNTLKQALETLDSKGVEEIAGKGGKAIFDVIRA